jgi:RNA recognition motif-containing protein
MAASGTREIYKLFIGGLTIETTEIQVEEHFSKFGFVFDILIIRNRATGVSKGYGFISCNNIKTYQRIVNTEHVISGRVIDCHDSFKKSDDPEKFKENANKKIFVGGISLETSDDDLHAYFSRFGVVRQAYVIKDPVTRRSKKFGFAIMKDQAAVDAVLGIPTHSIRGIPVSCKLFVRFDEETPDKSLGNQEQVQKKNHAGKGEVKIKQDQMGIYPEYSENFDQSKFEQVFPSLAQGHHEMSSSHYPTGEDINFGARTSTYESGFEQNSIQQQNNYQPFNEGQTLNNPSGIEAAGFSKVGISKTNGKKDLRYEVTHEMKPNSTMYANPKTSNVVHSGFSSAHPAESIAPPHREPGPNSSKHHQKSFGIQGDSRYEDANTGVRLQETKEGTLLLRGSRIGDFFHLSEVRSIQAFIGEFFNLRESLFRFNFSPLPQEHHIGLRHRRR